MPAPSRRLLVITLTGILLTIRGVNTIGKFDEAATARETPVCQLGASKSIELVLNETKLGTREFHAVAGVP